MHENPGSRRQVGVPLADILPKKQHCWRRPFSVRWIVNGDKNKKKKKVKIRILRIFLYWMNTEDNNRRNITLSFMNFDIIHVIMKIKKGFLSSVLRSVKKNIYFQFLSKQHRFNSIKECRKTSLLFLASSQLTFTAIRTRDIPPSLFFFLSIE